MENKEAFKSKLVYGLGMGVGLILAPIYLALKGIYYLILGYIGIALMMGVAALVLILFCMSLC